MNNNEIQIRISGDGRAFIAEAGKTTAAIEQIGVSASRQVSSFEAVQAQGQKYLKTLEDQHALLGKSAGEVAAYTAQQQGFSTAVQYQAKLIADKIDLFHKEEAATRKLAASQEMLAQRASQIQRDQLAAREQFIQALAQQNATAGMSWGERKLFDARKMGFNDEQMRIVKQHITEVEKKLDGASGAARRLGQAGEISAGQTANAMRQLPMQLTDAVTQLAGGQNPLLILVQQGGQIKDSFGGIGPAIKAMTSALSPMAVALGASALAAGTLGFAFYSGSREVQAFNKAIAFTGNMAGVSSQQLMDMSRNIGESIGTQGAAAEALALIAGSGKVAGDRIERYGEVAIRVNKATGKEVQATVNEFALLAEAPVAGSIKLNETYHYLTAAVLEQITALEKQGRTQEAVKLAQDTYASATERMSGQVVENLGYIERGWKAVGSAIAGTWDYVKNIGRPITDLQKLTELQARYNALTSNPGNFSAQYEAKGLRPQIEALQENIRLSKKSQAIQQEQNQIRENGVIAFTYLSKGSENAADKQEKYNVALAKERDMQEKLRKYQPNNPLLSPAAIAKREAKIRTDIYGDEKKGSTRGLINAPTDSAVAGLRAKIDAANEAALGVDKLNEGERETLRIEQLLQVAVAKGANAKVQSALQAQLADAKTLAVQLDVNAALAANAKEQAKLKDSREKELEQLQRAATEWTQKLRFHGLEKSAIDDANLAKVDALIIDKEHQLAMGANNKLLEEEVAHLRKKAELMRTAVSNRSAVEELEAADQAAKKFEDDRKKEADAIASAYSGAFQSMEDAMVSFASGGKTSFKGMINSMVSDLMRYQARQSMTLPLSNFMSNAGGVSGLIQAGIGLLSGTGSAGISTGMSGNMTWGGNQFMPTSLLSAAGGFDIPRGVNPLVQAHEEEMILPKYLANPIREMARNGGATGGAGDMHVHLSPTIDARGADAAAVGRIEAALGELARNVPSMATTAVRQAMVKSRATPQF